MAPAGRDAQLAALFLTSLADVNWLAAFFPILMET